MVNKEDFAKRLKKVMSYYNESAASFSEKIGVQRSSISHILSGRNKPSLEFILKVLSSYPEVDLYWLLLGKGVFPKTEHSDAKTIEQKLNNPKFKNTKVENSTLKVENSTLKDIERIVIFYNDGSFKNFQN